MAKIMLVEDDKSLREIYSIRLVAEGYEVVSAGDGEEALALAVQQKPDLIVSDVMMPKISGFDMLDILRSTPETKDIKVIMMTALSSDDQRQRGESLGANKYLVKSQVGIEDVINAVHEVLEGKDDGATEAATKAPETAVSAMSAPAATPVATPVATAPTTAPVAATPVSPAPAQMAQAAPAPAQMAQAAPAAPAMAAPATPAMAPTAPVAQTPVQSANSIAMEAQLNEEVPAVQNTWPGSPAQ